MLNMNTFVSERKMNLKKDSIVRSLHGAAGTDKSANNIGGYPGNYSDNYRLILDSIKHAVIHPSAALRNQYYNQISLHTLGSIIAASVRLRPFGIMSASS